MLSVHLEKEKGSHTSRFSMHLTSCPCNYEYLSFKCTGEVNTLANSHYHAVINVHVNSYCYTYCILQDLHVQMQMQLPMAVAF